MELPLGSEKKLSIEEQYAQGPGIAPDINTMQMPQQQTKEERLVMVEAELSDLRKLVEYDRLTVEVDSLIMKQMEQWVMLGKIPVSSLPDSPFKNELTIRVNEAGILSGKLPLQNEQGQATVPGLQGLELLTRQISSMGYLADYRKGAMDAAQNQKDMEEASSIVNHLIVDAHQYNGDNAGEMQNFVQGLSLDDAPVLTVADPLKRVAIRVPSDGKLNGRELSWFPTDWVIKDTNGEFWSMTDENYKQNTKS